MESANLAIDSTASDSSTIRKTSAHFKNEWLSAGGSTKDSHHSDDNCSNSDEEKIREEILDSYSKIWKAIPGGNPAGITSGARVSRSPDLLPSASPNSLCKSFASNLSLTDPSPLLAPSTPFVQRVDLFETLRDELSPEKLK